jgi:hypothetical protein
MARNGKIARLPQGVRSHLNSRLQDGHDGNQILTWLNSLPAVRRVLADNFGDHPINEQNLSEWRQGGYQEWLLCQDIAAQAAQLAASREDLQELAPGQSPAELLTAAITFRCNAILAGQPAELDDKALIQVRALGHLCHAVAKVLRGEQNAARLKMETERWELERERMRAENEEAEKTRLRAALSARFMTLMKVPEWLDKMGGGPRAAIAAGILREIQMCQDPAHFHSEIIGDSPEAFDRYVEEQVKKAPPRKTEIESAAEACRQMDAALGIGKNGEMPSRIPRRTKPHHHSRHRVRPPSHRVHKVHKVHAVHQAPPPADPPTPTEDVASSLPLDPPPSAPTPPIIADPAINPNQA